MYILKIELIEVIKDAPNAATKLLSSLNNSIYNTISLNDAEWYYIFDVIDIETKFFDKFKLTYEERLSYEINNASCYLHMKINDTNTYDKLTILPNVVISIIKEYVKILLEEQAKLTEKEIQQLVENGTHNYDLDSILEKIYNNGIISLTPFEKMFLDKYSHEI